MSEPIHLVVERAASGGEVARVYYDLLPERLTRKGQTALIYQLRLDRLEPEHRDFWLSKSCAEQLDVYRWLKGEGTLPAANVAEPPKDKPREGRQLGEWWAPPKNPWPDRPPDPFPDADSIRPPPASAG